MSMEKYPVTDTGGWGKERVQNGSVVLLGHLRPQAVGARILPDVDAIVQSDPSPVMNVAEGDPA